ncbi:MAG: hypothetical protein DMG54_15660 [Acidobacteria bacterium]|nr:MAG: hypothetical protein DMG54_15660 [Acidobacteriota bacterium]
MARGSFQTSALVLAPAGKLIHTSKSLHLLSYVFGQVIRETESGIGERHVQLVLLLEQLQLLRLDGVRRLYLTLPFP